jgi:hypothetical protein
MSNLLWTCAACDQHAVVVNRCWFFDSCSGPEFPATGATHTESEEKEDGR